MDSASGWTDAGAGHVADIHQYPGPSMPALGRDRAAVLGEFGGLGLPTRGHTWQDEKNWGYVSYKDPGELETAYRDKMAQLRLLVARGLSAAIYTQTTDVEIETNGLMTYDRAVAKIPASTLAELHRNLYADLSVVTTVLPASETEGRVWRYATTAPDETWMQPGFDDRAWLRGPAPFGDGAPEGVPVHTRWTTPGIWMRQSFEWRGGSPTGLYLLIAHDEDAVVYLNGVEAASVAGYATGYVMVPIREAAAAAVKPGTNTMAVRCRQTKGAQAVDVGLVQVAPARWAGAWVGVRRQAPLSCRDGVAYRFLIRQFEGNGQRAAARAER